MADETLPEPLSLTLRNVKQHRELTVDLTGRMIVLVGPNGVGKSTVLKAIRALGRLSEEERDQPYPSPEERLWHAFDYPGTLDWHEFQSSWSQKLENPRIDAMFAQGLLSLALSGQTPFLVLPGSGPLPRDHDTQDRKIAARCESAFTRSFRSRYLQPENTALASASPVTEQRLGTRGENLASRVAHLVLRAPAQHQKLLQSMAEVIAGVSHIGADTVMLPDGRPAYELEFQFGGARVRGKDVSEGTLIALAVLTLVSDPLVRLVLLDDVDRGLHPTAQKALIEQLRGVLKARPELKIICTTHSPYIVSHFEPSEVRVLGRSKTTGDTVCKRLDQHPKIDEYKRYLDAGEYWASVGEDWVGE
jgi:predicted ATPase